jgi:hypothetical protein
MTTSQGSKIISKQVCEQFPVLYHYTGVDGLLGIVSEKRIRATHMAYLNDKAEQTGFFEQRLQHLLSEDFVKEMQHHLQGFCNDFGRAMLSTPPCFAACFCKPPVHDGNDGLLSQWRGYGRNGGYAIVFDTLLIREALQEMQELYSHTSFYCFPVEYFPADGKGEFQFSESKTIEKFLKEQLVKKPKIRAKDLSSGEFSALSILSSIYKNRGFCEEQEVRVVTMPTPQDIFDEIGISDKGVVPIELRTKEGTLVPYINLNIQTKDGRTPISRIIVGPHPDAEKRAQSVRVLLKKYKIDADVLTSGTPYIG